MTTPTPETPAGERWECGPHANAWNGHDARCRKIGTETPAGGLTTDRAHIEAIQSLTDATFIPDFAGVDWTAVDRTVQRFVADLQGILRAALTATEDGDRT